MEFTETTSQGLGGGRNGRLCLMARVSVMKNEGFWRWMVEMVAKCECIIPLNCILKKDYNGKLCHVYLTTIFKKRIRRHINKYNVIRVS